MSIPREAYQTLQSIVGEEWVSDDPAICAADRYCSLSDPTDEMRRPACSIEPASTEEIQAIVRVANRYKLPFVVTSTFYGADTYARKDNTILIDLKRMDNLEIDEKNQRAVVEPGVYNLTLQNALAPLGYFYAPDPASQRVSTIGGNVGENSGGPLCLKYGVTTNHVLGMEVVMPTGEILQTGTESTRKPAGIEATKFLVGSEGLLCIITKIRMRLIPLPCFENIVAYYNRTEDILDTVMAMYKQHITTPMFFEYLDEKSSKVGFEAVGLKAPPGAVAMMSMDSSTQVGCEEKAKRFLEFLKVGNPIEAKIVKDTEEWAQIWSSRAEAGNYIYRLGSTFGSEITVRVDKLKEAFHEAQDIILNLESYKGNEFYSFGHIGAPTIHAYAFIPTKDIPNDVKIAIANEVRKKTEALNVKYGGCGGEWGLTAQRASFLKKKYGDAYYEFLTHLKKTMDPNNILNRGNLEGWM